MPIHYVVGDATQPVGEGRKIIAHICNDAGYWGKGFVMAVSQKWPHVRDWYLSWHSYVQVKDCGLKLGSVQFIPVADDILVANMVAQHGIASKGESRPIRYRALFDCLKKVRKRAQKTGSSVHMPRIGCGLAGGTWEETLASISWTLDAYGIDVYVYDLPQSDQKTT